MMYNYRSLLDSINCSIKHRVAKHYNLLPAIRVTMIKAQLDEFREDVISITNDLRLENIKIFTELVAERKHSEHLQKLLYGFTLINVTLLGVLMYVLYR